MKKIFFALLIISSCINSFSQKKGESKIIVTLNDSTRIFEKVKYVLEQRGFQIHNEYSKNRDTIITNARAIYYPTGYVIIQAEIKEQTVTLSGWVKAILPGNMGKENSKDVNLKTYRTITYFEGSSSWRQLEYVAKELRNNNFIYEEVKKNETRSNQPLKSKEIRLRELKDLFEKELITKEEYDRAKQKILDEN